MAILDAERLLNRLSFLDPLSDLCQKQIGEWLKRGGDGAQIAKDALNGVWLGHPLHPALTDVPIGAWAASALLDLSRQRRAADLVLAAGCASGAAAAVAGIADWQDSYGQERRTGAAHGLLNLGALGLLSAALWLRLSGRRRAALPLRLLGLGAGATAGYLGGDLVFRLGTQVNRNAFTESPSEWVSAGPAERVEEGAMIPAHAGEATVLLARVEGSICAVSAICSHAGGPLAEGELSDGVVTCPWHGSRFDLRTGEVLQGPATAPLPSYRSQVNQGGEVEVRAGWAP